MINSFTDDDIAIVLVGKKLLNELLFVKAFVTVVKRAYPPVTITSYKLFNIDTGAICVKVGVPVNVLDGNDVLNAFVPVHTLLLANIPLTVYSVSPIALVINWLLLVMLVIVLVGKLVSNVAVPSKVADEVTSNVSHVISSADTFSPVKEIIPFIDLSIVCPPLVYDIIVRGEINSPPTTPFNPLQRGLHPLLIPSIYKGGGKGERSSL